MSALRAVEAHEQVPLTIERLRMLPTISVVEAAEVLGISRNAAYEAVHRGELISLKFGARIVIPVAPLLRLIGAEAG